MNFLKELAALSIVALLIVSCTKNDVSPGFYFLPGGNSGDSSLVVVPQVDTLSKPTTVNFSVPQTPQTSPFVAFRNGTQNAVRTTSVVGALMQNIPSEIINILTQGNKPLQQTLPTDSVMGWRVQDATGINPINGLSGNISRILSPQVSNALSYTFTFFPDGYYLRHSHVNTAWHELGWFQVAMSDGFPIAIVYNASFSGVNFSNPPLNPTGTNVNQPKGFGIWGLDRSAFFPLVTLDRNATSVVLRMTPVKY